MERNHFGEYRRSTEGKDWKPEERQKMLAHRASLRNPAADAHTGAVNQHFREQAARLVMEVVQVKMRYAVSFGVGEMRFQRIDGAADDCALVRGGYVVMRWPAGQRELRLEAEVGAGCALSARAFEQAARERVAEKYAKDAARRAAQEMEAA